jgi:hypothetical protein
LHGFHTLETCIERNGDDLNIFALIFCVITLVTLMFTIFAFLMSQLASHYPSLPHAWPRYIKHTTLFIPGTVSALTTAFLFAYPLLVLLPRFYWLVTSIASAFFVLVRYNTYFSISTISIYEVIVLFDLTCLLIFVPILSKVMFPIIRRYLHGAG